MKTPRKIKSRVTRKSLYITLAVGLFIVALALVTHPFSVEAKGRFGFQKSPEQIVERLTDRLGLTEEQAAEIEPIIKESLERKREVFDKYGEKRQTVRQAMRNEMQVIRDETHKELSHILTDEQSEDLRTLKEERHEWSTDAPTATGDHGRETVRTSP